MSLIDFSIRRKVTIAMFTIGIILFGFVSLSRLNINLLPELSYPTLTVRTEFEGAAPAEIENLISRPVEEALGVVKNVQQVQSISRSGQSDVTLEFAWGTDMDFASIDVREKIDATATRSRTTGYSAVRRSIRSCGTLFSLKKINRQRMLISPLCRMNNPNHQKTKLVN